MSLFTSKISWRYALPRIFVPTRGLASEASSSPILSSIHYKVVVVGGGTAGISVSSQIAKSSLLRTEGNADRKHIAIVEPKDEHYYQPLWTFVGAGLKTLAESKKDMIDVVPKEVDLIKSTIQRILPQENSAILSNGQKLSYDVLVVAPGFVLRPDLIPGLEEALKSDSSPVSTNYSEDYVEKTDHLIRNFKSGNAIFTQPATPIKCAGAPQKIMYLAEEAFRLRGIRSSANVTFMQGMAKIFAVDKYATTLNQICADRDIKVNLSHNLIFISPSTKVGTFKNMTTDELVEQPYDLLHVAPPMTPPAFIKESGISNEGGYVDVDKGSCRHITFGNIFSLGDASNLPTSKTAAAVAAQSGVAARNVLALLEKKKRDPFVDLRNVLDKGNIDSSYDGYTSCPLIVGKNELILAEFAYDLKVKETFPFDQSQPRSSMYWLTSEVIPQIYWKYQLQGAWEGPNKVRDLLNPTGRN